MTLKFYIPGKQQTSPENEWVGEHVCPTEIVPLGYVSFRRWDIEN